MSPTDVDFFETEREMDTVETERDTIDIAEEKTLETEEKICETEEKVWESEEKTTFNNKKLFVIFSVFGMSKHQTELVFQFLTKEEIEYKVADETPEDRAARREEIPETIKSLDNLDDKELLDWTCGVVSQLVDYETNYERVIEEYKKCDTLTPSQRNRLIAWAARDNAIPTV